MVAAFAAKVSNPFQFYKNWKGLHCFYSEIVYFLLFFYLILSNFCKFGKNKDCKKEGLIAGKQQGLHRNRKPDAAPE